MPRPFAQQALQGNDRERNNQISDKERNRALRFVQMRLLEQRKERKQDDDGARKDDLPLEMAAIGFIEAHARGCRFLVSGTSLSKGWQHRKDSIRDWRDLGNATHWLDLGRVS